MLNKSNSYPNVNSLEGCNISRLEYFAGVCNAW